MTPPVLNPRTLFNLTASWVVQYARCLEDLSAVLTCVDYCQSLSVLGQRRRCPRVMGIHVLEDDYMVGYNGGRCTGSVPRTCFVLGQTACG